jgi:hypothetical protein
VTRRKLRGIFRPSGSDLLARPMEKEEEHPSTIAQLFRRKHLNKPFGSLRRGGTAVFVGLPADQHVHLRFLTSWQALSK